MHYGSYRNWYKRAVWLHRRDAQLRAFPLCEACLQRGIVEAATIADHQVPHRGNFELFKYGALSSLCKRCHDSKTLCEKGFQPPVTYGRDGWPIEDEPMPTPTQTASMDLVDMLLPKARP